MRRSFLTARLSFLAVMGVLAFLAEAVCEDGIPGDPRNPRRADLSLGDWLSLPAFSFGQETGGAAPSQAPPPKEEKAKEPEPMPIMPMKASEIPEASWPVVGIYTAPDTKDLGKLSGIPWLEGTKIRGWVDTNYVYNFNEPDRTVVNTNQGASIVKGHNVSVEGRTFDIHHNSFSLSLAEIEIEKVPEFGGVGFKLDMAFGETQEIMVDTIRGSLGPSAPGDSVTDFDKVFQHASISYLAPVGRGLRIDAGKFVTHIGGETITTVKNWNYSHSWFYTYAIPFQDTGVRLNYQWTDTFYTEFYFLNGWNVTVDNNRGKTFGPSIGWTAAPWLALYTNYLVGPEQTENNGDMRNIWDTQAFIGPFKGWNFMINYDLGYEHDVPTGSDNALWTSIAGYARYAVTDWFEPSLRIEHFYDEEGFATGVHQDVWSYTLTLNFKIGLGKSKGSMILLRPELRYDRSNEDFFTDENVFREDKDQVTLGMGASWLF